MTNSLSAALVQRERAAAVYTSITHNILICAFIFLCNSLVTIHHPSFKIQIKHLSPESCYFYLQVLDLFEELNLPFSLKHKKQSKKSGVCLGVGSLGMKEEGARQRISRLKDKHCLYLDGWLRWSWWGWWQSSDSDSERLCVRKNLCHLLTHTVCVTCTHFIIIIRLIPVVSSR